MRPRPVGDYCNLRCRYCYAEPEVVPKKEVMPYEVLKILIGKYLSYSQYPIFSWHGGEPTLAGHDFFRNAMELVERYKRPHQKVKHTIQTNATKITPELAELFKAFGFEVNISLDGPERIHGINRIFKNGTNSFKLVMRGIKTLWKNGINPEILCTVSRETLPYAEEVFEFLVSRGFKRIGYNAALDIREGKVSITGDEWFEYLRKVFDMWMEVGDPNLQVYNLNKVIAWLLKDRLNFCVYDKICFSWISVAPNGNMYPCEYLRESYRYCFGNISQVDFSDIPLSATYRRFKERLEPIPKRCQKCEFFSLCGNGCPQERVGEDGRASYSGGYVFCKEMRSLYEYINQSVERLGGEERRFIQNAFENVAKRIEDAHGRMNNAT